MKKPMYKIERMSRRTVTIRTVFLSYNVSPGCTTGCRVRIRTQYYSHGKGGYDISKWVQGPTLDFLKDIDMTSDKLKDWLSTELEKDDEGNPITYRR